MARTSGPALADDSVLELVDGVAAGIEKHFPGTIDRIAEVRVFRRGHPMFIPTPGRMALLDQIRAPFGPIQFAHTDAHTLPSFWGALMAADAAVKNARKTLACETPPPRATSLDLRSTRRERRSREPKRA